MAAAQGDTPVAKSPAPRYAAIRAKYGIDDCKIMDFIGFSVVDPALQRIRPHTREIWEMFAKPLPLPAVPAMDALLQEGFPKLINLEIYVDGTQDEPTEAQAIPTFKFPAPKFPALRGLVLVGAASHLTPPLASRLTRLVMCNEPGRSNLLPLAPFLDCLRCLDCLDELGVYNCFAPATAEDPVGYKPHKVHLTSIAIEDYPYNIRHMMSVLIPASNASVCLRANLRGASAEQCRTVFTTVLPRERDCLLVLRRITDVVVYCASNACYVAAKEDLGGLVTIEALTDVPETPSEDYRYARGALFEAMVRTVHDIFPAAPIEALEVTGDIDEISISTWIATLSRFPRLRRLEVDFYERQSPMPDALLTALTMSDWQPKRSPSPLCWQLEELTLYGDAPGTELAEAIQRCLKLRKERGGCVELRKLEVSLYCHDTDIAPEEERRYKELFRGLGAERAIVHVYAKRSTRIEFLAMVPSPYECCIQ